MANKFEVATNNYGNNFSNNNGNHHYTTYGHKYDDSDYVLAKFNGQVDPASISSTKNGRPSNNVITYGQGYDVSVKAHSHVDDYTQTITLGWPDNINTRGKIEGTLSFSVDKTTIPSSGGTVNIHFPDLKYTATSDTRGYRYVNVTLKPNVPSNPETLDDDGTSSGNSTVYTTTYLGQNRQGFLNRKEPRMDYVIYSSYGAKGGNPFVLKSQSNIYNISGNLSTRSLSASYMHMYDNVNKNYSYAYAPYHNELKSDSASLTSEGVGWTQKNFRLEVSDNYLSTFAKKLTISYDNSYWTISYNGVSDMPFKAAFDYQGTYGGVTSSSSTDTNLTSYDRSTILHDQFLGIANTSTEPSYLETSYTISQPKATLTPSYMWSLPETPGTGVSNFDSKTKVKYVDFGTKENKYMESTKGTVGFLNVAKQGHYMGYVTGNLDVDGLIVGGGIIPMDQGTIKEGTFGNLKWTDCENRTERFFNVRVSTKYDNCRNQNITSITNEYADGDKRKPEVTLKCRQLPAHWNHPAIRIHVKGSRYNIPNDSRFDDVNPVWVLYTNDDEYSIEGNENYHIDWSIEGHDRWFDTSTIDDANTKLLTKIIMPNIESPYVKSTVNGSILASASATYVNPVASSVTITPTWFVNYTRGYDKGFDAADWKYSFDHIEGWENGINGKGLGMSYSGVVPFNDFYVHLNKTDDFNYRYPSVTLIALSNNQLFHLDTTTITADDDTKLASGHKSEGFTVSIYDNSKVGTTWYAAVTTEPTETTGGVVSVSPGTLANTTSRSTTISFSNSFDASLTSGSITSPDDITITQGPDKWGGSDDFYYCVGIAGDGGHDSALTNSLGICVIYKLTAFEKGLKSIPAVEYTPNKYNIGKLREPHQLTVLGIGSVKSQGYTALASESSKTVSFAGSPEIEDEDEFTYVSTVQVWCDNYQSAGVTEGPNGKSSRNLKTWTVYPNDANWRVQYKLNNGSWQDSATLNFGTNYGSTTAASCVANSRTGDDIRLGAFDYTPERYSGSTTKYHKFQIRVKDLSSTGSAFENDTEYTITQASVSGSATSRTFTFTTSGTRCTTSTPSSVSGTTSQTNVGSFTVTPASDPFYNYTTYTNGMVVNSFDKSNYSEGITKDGTLSATHSGNVDFLNGSTIDFYFGISGSTSDYITWSRTGYINYKFYYIYYVDCYDSSNSLVSSKSSGDLQSSLVTSTPSSNAINYYKRRLVNGSWSASLTQRITSTGTYSVTGGWATTSGAEYSTSKRSTFSITVRTYTVETEYQYQIPSGTGTMSITFYGGDGNVASNPIVLESTDTSTKYYVVPKGPNVYIQERHRTYRMFNTGSKESYSSWTSYANTSELAWTVNPSTYQFSNPNVGQTLSKEFTLSVVTVYNGQSVNVNGAAGSTATFSVRKRGGDYYEYRVTSITLTANSEYTTYNESYSVTPTFSYAVERRLMNGDGVAKGNWESTSNNGEVTLNETTHTFTSLQINVAQSFTFKTSIKAGVTNATNASLPSVTVKVTRLADTVYRTVYKYVGSVSATVTNQTLTAFDTNKSQVANVSAWSCKYYKRTDSRKSNETTYTDGTWTLVDNNNYGSINATTYTFTNVPLGSSASTYGTAQYTFTVTPPSNPNNMNEGTWTATVYAYKYGKTYYNA